MGDRNDSFGGNPIGNLMIDHVSASWGLDENMSMYRHMYQPPEGGKELKLPTVNITIQNSIFSEAINKYHHALAARSGATTALSTTTCGLATTGRNPSVGMIYDFTFANNVLFNWRQPYDRRRGSPQFLQHHQQLFQTGSGDPQEQAIAHRLLKPDPGGPGHRWMITEKPTWPVTSSRATPK